MSAGDMFVGVEGGPTSVAERQISDVQKRPSL